MLAKRLMLLGSTLLVCSLMSSRYKEDIRKVTICFKQDDVFYNLNIVEYVGTRGSVINTDVKRVDNDPLAQVSDMSLLEHHIQQSISHVKNIPKIHEAIRYISSLCDLGITIKES